MDETPEIRPSTSSSDHSFSQPSLGDQTKQEQEQLNRGPGLYAVPVHPFMQTIGGIPSNALIPFTYNIPTEHSSAEAREANGEQGQPGQHPPQPHEAGPQVQVVRRLVAIRIDLLLILKLAALIFLFNQDGSKQRLAFLLFFASFIYLYQTGALAPVMRWLSQGMPRAAAPPQPPRAAARADNLPAAGALGNENVGIAGGQPVGENENQQVNDGNMAIRNENAQEPVRGEGGNRWWAVVKEIQIIIFGFITSLLPGYHNLD